MTDQRVPTEAEWRLVGQCMMSVISAEPHLHRMKWWLAESGDDKVRKLFYETEVYCSRRFRPLEDSNDLDALVRAMQADGYGMIRINSANGMNTAEASHKEATPTAASLIGNQWYTTDRYATTFACIDALAAEAEKENENPDCSPNPNRIERGYSGQPSADDGFMG